MVSYSPESLDILKIGISVTWIGTDIMAMMKARMGSRSLKRMRDSG